MDKVFLHSQRCFAEEVEQHPDVYVLKFVISDFSTNLNSVRLNRDNIESWMKTLVGKPLVGKIVSTVDGELDFSGHNLRKVPKRDEFGNPYYEASFDTDAFGSFQDVEIETFDGTEFIVATCWLWKRFKKACSVIMERIKEGVLNTSWEIDVKQSHAETSGGQIAKVIDNGVFTAHCLLGKHIIPAYECSRLLEVAEAEQDSVVEEFTRAYAQDIDLLNDKYSKAKEEKDLKLEEKNQVVAESGNEVAPVAETDVSACGDDKEKDEKAEAPDEDEKPDEEKESNEPGAEEKEDKEDPETSSLTEYDLMRKIAKQLEDADVYEWIEFFFPAENTFWVKSRERGATDLDYKVYTYKVKDDEVVLSEPRAGKLAVEFSEINTKFNELTSAVASANAQIVEKDKQIAELLPYKERCDKADAERAAAEMAEKKNQLRNYAMASKLISEAEVAEGGNLVEMIENLDEDGIRRVIAERYMKNLANGSTTTETASVNNNVKKNIESSQDDASVSFMSIMRSYLGGI